MSDNLQYSHQLHEFDPIYNSDSRILILGSFPSVESRKESFYYMNKTNRFWKVISKIFNEDIPLTKEAKKDFLLKNNIALWDVIKSCDIIGSSDLSIKSVEVNDITQILNVSNIRYIYVNGKKAANLYEKHLKPITNIDAIILPSTSAANARYSFEDLYNEWLKLIR